MGSKYASGFNHYNKISKKINDSLYLEAATESYEVPDLL